MSSSRSWRAISALLFISACSHAEALPRRVAVAPVGVLGLPMERGEGLRRSLEEEAARAEAVRLIEPETVDAALETKEPECLSTDPCLAVVGERVEAEVVLAVSLAGLGDTFLVRSRLIEVTGALLVQDVRETVVGGPDEIGAYAGTLIGRLFASERPAAWYKRWWVWTIIGGALGAAAGTTALAVALSQGPPEDAVRLGDL